MSREIAWENSLLDKIDALMDQGLTQAQAVSVALSEQIEPDYDYDEEQVDELCAYSTPQQPLNCYRKVGHKE